MEENVKNRKRSKGEKGRRFEEAMERANWGRKGKTKVKESNRGKEGKLRTNERVKK